MSGTMIIVTAILSFFVATPPAHAIECAKFKAEGVYEIMGEHFRLTFAGCEMAELLSGTSGVTLEFILDGKTHSTLPKELYQWREKTQKEPPQPGSDISLADLSLLEKLTYVSSLTEDDDGASVHLKLEAVVRPRNSKKIRRIFLKGRAAIYLRNYKKSADCYDCKNQGFFEKKSKLQLWLGNVEITKVEGGTKKEAEAVLIDAINGDGHYRNLIALKESKSGKSYESVEDLILVENFPQTAQFTPASPPTPSSTPTPGATEQVFLLEPSKTGKDGKDGRESIEEMRKQLDQKLKSKPVIIKPDN